MKSDKEDGNEDEEGNSIIEAFSCKETLKMLMTLNNILLQYENTRLKLFFFFVL